MLFEVTLLKRINEENGLETFVTRVFHHSKQEEWSNTFMNHIKDGFILYWSKLMNVAGDTVGEFYSFEAINDEG